MDGFRATPATNNQPQGQRMSHLRIGLPSKGRLADQAAELLVLAGLSFRRQSRGLFARVDGFPIDITFLRADDIPLLCAEGAAHWPRPPEDASTLPTSAPPAACRWSEKQRSEAFQ